MSKALLTVSEMDWGKIQEHFTPEEKNQLQGATCSHVICPPVWVLDEALLDVALLAKLKVRLEGAKRL